MPQFTVFFSSTQPVGANNLGPYYMQVKILKSEIPLHLSEH